MFEQFSDNEFAAWLAGFFDGEGCIHIPGTTGIELSIANTVREVIEGIQAKLGFGTITEVVFDESKWKNKYHWRVRTYDEAESVIELMYPYLTLKKPTADKALARIREKRALRLDRKRRNEEIVRLAAQGFTYLELAERFNMGYRNVALICKGAVSSGKGGHAKPEIRELRRARQRHQKPPVQPKTKSRILSR